MITVVMRLIVIGLAIGLLVMIMVVVGIVGELVVVKMISETVVAVGKVSIGISSKVVVSDLGVVNVVILDGVVEMVTTV